MSGVLVVLEERAGRIGRPGWEAAAAARQLAGPDSIAVAVVGAQTEALAVEAAGRPFAKVLRVEHPLLALYTADGFKLALEQLIRAESPEFVVFPHTYQVRDYAPALAARFSQSLVSDVVGIEPGPVFLRQLMQGRLAGAYRPQNGGPCFVSVQAGSFRAESPEARAGAPAAITLFTPTLSAE
jgi:electron transfer flavoprotein alpha subunit